MAKIKLIVRKMSFLAIASSFLLISCNRNNEIHNDEIKTIKIAVSEGKKIISQCLLIGLKSFIQINIKLR